MVRRRGVNHQTVVEKVAENLDADLLNMKPWLSRGTHGLREWLGIVSASLELEGGDPRADICPVMKELGVDMAECFEVMFRYDVERKKGRK